MPGLRLAWALSQEDEESADSMLANFHWATTIVRAKIRNADIFPHLQEEIRNFPSPFLLFLPVAVSLDLDMGIAPKRQLRREPDGPDIVLHDGDAESRWRVVEKPEIRIADAAAKADATHLHAREVVPLSWAMPLDVKCEQSGRFWAFFPTDTPTRLPGILNAPWKLNSDRKALIPGDWNAALMREAAKLVAEHLPRLSTALDPGRPLDAFPRQLERQDEPAAPLVEALWDHIKAAPIIPDAQGALHAASELRRPPLDDLDLHKEWRGLAGDEAQGRWVHPSCLSGDRPARLTELARQLRKADEKVLSQAKASDWFAEIASNDPESAKQVFDLVERYDKKLQQGQWSRERDTLAIIPSENGKLCTPGQLVIAPAGIPIPGHESVAQALVNDPEPYRILCDVLKVKRLDEQGWLGLLDEKRVQANRRQGDIAEPRSNDEAWRHLWDTLRLAPDDIRKGFVDKHREELRARRRDDAWVLHDEILLPGNIVSADDPEPGNRGVLVEEATHGNDHDLLTAIGVSDLPTGKRQWDAKLPSDPPEIKDWDWSVAAIRHYRTKHKGGADSYLKPLSSMDMPNGWRLLSTLEGLPNSRLAEQLLAAIAGFGPDINFGHSGGKESQKKYPPERVAHPVRWFIRHHGTFAIGRHAIPLETMLARRDIPALAHVRGWAAIELRLGGFDNLIGAPALPTPSAEQIKTFWQALFECLATPEAIANDRLRDLWSAAANDGQAPDVLHDPSGEIPLADAYVTSSPNLAQLARKQGMLAITLDVDTLTLWLKRGARELDELFKPGWTEILSAPVLLETAVPELADVLNDEAKRTALSQSVRDLKLVIEGQGQPIPCLQWQNVLHLDPDQLDALSRAQRLTAILHEAAAAGWLNKSEEEAQRLIANAQVEANRARVAAGNTLEERLLLATGEHSEPLIQAIGEAASKAIPEDCPPLQIAALALAMQGPAILLILKDALREEGLQPPSRWGGDEARAFVAALGFPETFAAATESKREAEEVVSGPIYLPALHDYQEKVVEGLRQLIDSGTGRRRAVVSLPTGGGKTRVAVQAAVDLVLQPAGDKRAVLWVAQTDELCEQAVQAFRQVWLNRGAQRTDLRIVRFWGGHKNPAASADGLPTAVIASIQTLNSRIGKEGLDWLNHPGLVVLDECHHAITKSYTELLKWLDAEAPRPGSEPKDEPPIIGLSATPFRGANDDEENLRLAKRFGQRWLPTDQEELHKKLTERGILSIAEHEGLKSPSILPPAMEERLSQQNDVDSIQFENFLVELNSWFAGDEDRNRMLVETINASSERSILFFTNSVSHAEEMAARLTLQGIPAAAVSGDTPSSARRYFLDRFQKGEIRVLCNHSVLTTGFDAPKTDMVLIARQVLSPVRYMQMVGRGLRGVKNGGTERCRIVTVLDNLGRFSGKHAYHICAKYFSLTQ